jgi:hypothetical protein
MQAALVMAVLLTLCNLVPRHMFISSDQSTSPQPLRKKLIESKVQPHHLLQARPTSLRMQQLAVMGSVQHRLEANFWLSLQQPRGAAPGEISRECDAHYGAGYLERWKATPFTLCGAEPGASSSGSSSIECYTDAQSPGREQPGRLQTICKSRNLIVDAASFMGQGNTGYAHHGGQHQYVQAPGSSGSVRAACSNMTQAHRAQLEAPSTAPWFLESLKVRCMCQRAPYPGPALQGRRQGRVEPRCLG